MAFDKKHISERAKSRLRKQARVRKKIRGTQELPRLCVFRSGQHVYGQVIDDSQGVTLAAASSLKLNGVKGKELAHEVGKKIAEQALAKKINEIVFDRNGYLYHGRVKSFAEGAREGGLSF